MNIGLDADLDSRPYSSERRDRRDRSRSPERWAKGSSPHPPSSSSRPSSFLSIYGLPHDANEAEVQALFAPIPGVVRLTLDRDEDQEEESGTGTRAMLEMASVAAAVAVMDSDWRDGAYFKEHRLRLEYSRAPSPPRGVFDDTDWVCSACRALNFSRRMLCYQCRAPRTAECYSVEPGAPSHVLRIANLEPHVTEQDLEYIVKPHAPLKVVRLVRDKFNGESRGFAFVYFYSVEDATLVMDKLDGTHLPGQRWKLRISFALDRMGLPDSDGGGGINTDGGGDYGQNSKGKNKNKRRRGAERNSDGADPLEMAGWEPKAFDEAALVVDDSGEGGQPSTAAAGGAGAVGNTSQHSHEGYEYDTVSGYMKEISTGYLYDASSGMFFHPTMQQWGTRDIATGEFVPYSAPQEATAAVVSGEEAVERKKGAVAEARGAVAGGKGEVVQSAAVIGAAPQVDPAALEAAAEERARLQREQEVKHQAAKKPLEQPKTVTGSVQGVIHKGKWAQRRAAQQTQQQQ